MNIKNTIIIIPFLLLLAGCNSVPERDLAMESPTELLTVHPDGKLVYRNRVMDENDVVIYPDGQGGERAAVKMLVPLHPPFYRDTIIVERISNAEIESVN